VTRREVKSCLVLFAFQKMTRVLTKLCFIQRKIAAGICTLKSTSGKETIRKTQIFELFPKFRCGIIYVEGNEVYEYKLFRRYSLNCASEGRFTGTNCESIFLCRRYAARIGRYEAGTS
jgi:hypothetical protein